MPPVPPVPQLANRLLSAVSERFLTSTEATVAQIISWPASRETTRGEDQAYSLIGLLGMYMSPTYGEGQDAFLRLQNKVINLSTDMSIFP